MRFSDFLRRCISPSRIYRQLYPAPSIEIRFRPYDEKDRDRLLKIYDENAPGRFPKNDRPGFESYLEKKDGSLFVIENAEHGVIACGGVHASGDEINTLMYGLVALQFQGMRIGSTSALARLVFATREPGRHFSFIYALDKSIPFYHRFGYGLVGYWQSEDGGKHPVGMLSYQRYMINPISAILRKRGHLIDPNLPLTNQGECPFIITPTWDGQYRLETRRPVAPAVEESPAQA